MIVAIGSGVVAFLVPNEYESRMKILVKNTRSDVPITPERTTGPGGTPIVNEVSENQINSEIELLTSEDLLKQVVTECGLYRTAPSILARLGLKEVNQTQAAQVEEAGRRLAKDLVITPVKKANIIDVKYSSSSPETAVAVLRKLQDLYLEKHLKLHRPPGTYDFFKTKAAEYEQELKSLKPTIITQSRTLPNQYSAERLNTLIVELQNRRTQLLTKFRADDRLVKEVDQQIRTTRAALERSSNESATEQSTGLNPLRQT